MGSYALDGGEPFRIVECVRKLLERINDGELIA